jgi:hypothetical protein
MGIKDGRNGDERKSVPRYEVSGRVGGVSGRGPKSKEDRDEHDERGARGDQSRAVPSEAEPRG